MTLASGNKQVMNSGRGPFARLFRLAGWTNSGAPQGDSKPPVVRPRRIKRREGLPAGSHVPCSARRSEPCLPPRHPHAGAALVRVAPLRHCPCQLRLHARGYRPEGGSGLVVLGKVVNEATFTCRRNVNLGEACIDCVTAGAVAGLPLALISDRVDRLSWRVHNWPVRSRR
ncbi:Dna2/Cas4 domain-containing protein [Kitasatospora sp. NPDC057542]|uniref:Dna2/Cas4 domain-containing protein n=1 Tax=Kitasatospora sp. NPDC057542 TaxID=3346162 RepID=UPI0036B59328